MRMLTVGLSVNPLTGVRRAVQLFFIHFYV